MVKRHTQVLLNMTLLCRPIAKLNITEQLRPGLKLIRMLLTLLTTKGNFMIHEVASEKNSNIQNLKSTGVHEGIGVAGWFGVVRMV